MKKFLYIFAIIALLLLINSLARSIYDLWSKRDIVSEARRQLQDEKDKNQKLKGEFSYVQTREFIEEEARNKLFLVRPNEKIVIVPTASQSATGNKKPDLPNWQKWLNLFW